MPTDEQLKDWDFMQDHLVPTPRDYILEMTVQTAYSVPGHIMEFGVAKGGSTRTIRRTLTRCESIWHKGPKKRIYALDSFEGLTEKYENAEVGTFAGDPPRIPGVTIVKGFFQDSLTPELAKEIGTVAFASLDADLYSSTIHVLQWLTPLLHTGSLLLFDEFLGEKESEKRAFQDWSAESGVKTVLLAELIRDPSGWGSTIDRRMLYQVVTDQPLQLQHQHPHLPQRVLGLARGFTRRMKEMAG